MRVLRSACPTDRRLAIRQMDDDLAVRFSCLLMMGIQRKGCVTSVRLSVGIDAMYGLLCSCSKGQEVFILTFPKSLCAVWTGLPPPGRAMGQKTDERSGLLSSGLSRDYLQAVWKPVIGTRRTERSLPWLAPGRGRRHTRDTLITSRDGLAVSNPDYSILTALMS